jgi:hypothetical protein
MNRKFVAVMLAAVVSGIFPQALLAKDKAPWVAGRVYDTDKSSPLANVSIRIVNVETGNVTDETTDKNGCYAFKNVSAGAYSLAVIYQGKDYLLPEKVMVEMAKEEAALPVCVALSDTALAMMEECKVCKDKIPIWLPILGGAGVVAGIAIGHGEDPVVSESRPE